MIQVKEFPNKSFETKEELFSELRENKAALIAQKKMSTKEADSICFVSTISNQKGEVIKADSVDVTDVNTLKLKLVINTTNVMDSHGDVHLKGIWNKSVREKKDLYLLQEHRMTFANIITDKVKASVSKMQWNELGQSYDGTTEALIFDAEINKRNDYMFNQYAKGYVKNHSVGMRYVKMALALNSDSKYDAEEKEIWDKHIEDIANKNEAEAQGYFWAVYEAKIIEGSAVPIGSNTVTPTLEIEVKQADIKSLEVIEPTAVTQTAPTEQQLKQVFNNLKFK